MKKIAICILVFVISSSICSQEVPSSVKIDSMERLIKKSDSLRYKNDMYGSLEYAFKAVNHAHKLKSNHYIAHSYLLIGAIQYEIIDYENSKKHLLKSIEYAEKTKEKTLLPYILNTLGNVYYDDKHDYKTALLHYKKAITLEKHRDNKNYQILLHNLIWAYMDLNQFDSAAPYLKEADSIDRIPDIPQIDRSSLYLLKARNHAYHKEIKKAQEYFDKSFTLLEKETFWLKGKSYFYQYRSQMYQDINDYPKAIADLKKLRENDRKVFENARLKNEEVTKARFKVDEYERALKIAEREKLLLLNIDKNNKTIIYISAASLILLIGVVFFYYRGYQSKKKSSELLKLKNNELYEAKSQAEKLSKIKSQFISTISHELRTPLYGVIGISSLLLESDTHSKNDKKLLNSLKISADYLLNLVNKVLKISKIDAEETALTMTPTYLFSLSKNIVQSFDYQAAEKENSLLLEYDHNIPNLLDIDPLRISEILMNLIGNAIKFTANGKIWLRIKLLSAQDQKASVRFEVEDTGIGIPEDQKEYIFEEFSQIGSPYENKQGTGLGLSIVRSLVQMMNGTVHFESNKHVGATFYFDLDLDISDNLNTIEDESVLEETISALNSKILVAEDNKINQLVTKNLLKSIGCNCTIVENGSEAVEILKKQSFDLVLMDINMPVLDGMQATSEIREFDNKTPIVALTASELSEVEDECKNAGMNDLINKPLNKKDLKETILKNLKLNNQT